MNFFVVACHLKCKTVMIDVFTKFVRVGGALVLSFGVLALIFYVFPSFIGIETASAAGASDLIEQLGDGVGQTIGLIANIINLVFSSLIWIVIFWMPTLMDNSFILEGDIGDKLQSIWVIMRNIVNIIFALGLVVVAFMNVINIGGESENYNLKKFIPRMAMALIAVNFTFLAARIVLDVNNVLTAAVFALPKSVTTITDFGGNASGVKFYDNYTCNFEKELKDGQRNDPRKVDEFGGATSLGGFCEKAKDAKIVELGSSNYSQKNWAWAMAGQFQGIQNLNQVARLAKQDFGTITINSIFSVILTLIYGSAYIVLFVILFARVIVLWITIMLSPILALFIALPDAKNLLGSEFDIQQKFLDHAFVPLKMSVPLSVGYIMLSQMTLAIDTQAPFLTGGEIDLNSTGELAKGASLQTIMYGIGATGVIWVGVFAATKGVVGEKFGETIKGYLGTAGSKVAQWPTYLPIFPVGGAGGQSIASVMEAAGEAERQLTTGKMQKQKQKQDLLSAMGFDTALGEAEDALKDFSRELSKPGGSISGLEGKLSSISGITDESKQKKFWASVASGNAGNEDMIKMAEMAGVTVPQLIERAGSKGSDPQRRDMMSKWKKSSSDGGGGSGVTRAATGAEYSLTGARVAAATGLTGSTTTKTSDLLDALASQKDDDHARLREALGGDSELMLQTMQQVLTSVGEGEVKLKDTTLADLEARATTLMGTLTESDEDSKLEERLQRLVASLKAARTP
jgi:hypothetical protein